MIIGPIGLSKKVVKAPLPTKGISNFISWRFNWWYRTNNLGVNGTAGLLAAHGVGEIATAEGLSHLEKEISSLSEEKKTRNETPIYEYYFKFPTSKIYG